MFFPVARPDCGPTQKPARKQERRAIKNVSYFDIFALHFALAFVFAQVCFGKDKTVGLIIPTRVELALVWFAPNVRSW